MILRPYQATDIELLMESLDRGEHPVVAWPTGAGKGVLIAAMIERLPGRILCVTHRKELISQNEAQALGVGSQDTGVYSAGLGRRETAERVIFAGVQSVYRRMDQLQEVGAFDYLIIDEAHLVALNAKGDTTMYGAIIRACEKAKRIGLTATPYRLSDGPIYGGSDTWFSTCPIERSIRELTELGYLSRLVGVQTAASVDLSNVRTRAGDYSLSDLAQASSEEEVVSLALDEVCYLARDRKSWLLFGVDISHTRLIRDGLRDRGIDAEMVTSETPADEGDAIIQRFKAAKIRALCNCEKYTTGFDARNVDCIALLRASQSKGLIVQMLGRGTRLSPETGKEDCLVLDMAGNLSRHLPLDGIPKTLRSPRLVEKDREIAAVAEERERQARHSVRAARGIDPLSDGEVRRLDVVDIKYFFKPASRYPDRKNLIATYKCLDDAGASQSITQYILVEYPGRPGAEAAAWFDRRGLAMPVRADWARPMLKYAPMPREIIVSKRSGWDVVVMEHFEEDG